MTSTSPFALLGFGLAALLQCTTPRTDAGTAATDAGTDAAAPDANLPDAGVPLTGAPPPPPPAPDDCTVRDTTEFTLAGRLPAPTHQARGIVVDDWLYVFPGGGSDEAWLAPIQPDGSLGDFVRGVPLPRTYYLAPEARRGADRLYLTGGSNTDVFAGRVGPDGIVTEWVPEPFLQRGRAHHASIAIGEVLIVGGGLAGSKGYSTSSIEVTWRDGDGLRPWTVVFSELSEWGAFPAGAARLGDHVYVGTGQELVRASLSTLHHWERMPGGGAIGLLGARGRTLLRAFSDQLLRETLAEDGSRGPATTLAVLPRSGEDDLAYGNPPVVLGPRHVYAVGGWGVNDGRDAPSDEVWIAPLCAE